MMDFKVSLRQNMVSRLTGLIMSQWKSTLLFWYVMTFYATTIVSMSQVSVPMLYGKIHGRFIYVQGSS